MRPAHISLIAILTLVAVLLYVADAGARAGTKPVGWGPLSSKKAAAKVKRNGFEPRPANRAANHRVPKRKLVAAWRARSEMPYARYVNGRFEGTTDEIIQWGAYKWGLDEDLLRAVAVVESWWQMEAVGDNGDSFGLYQVRRPYHCWDECNIARRFTAFNADYYGGDHPRLLRRQDGMAEHGRARSRLRCRRHPGLGRRLVLGPLVHPALARLLRRRAAAPGRAHLAHAELHPRLRRSAPT